MAIRETSWATCQVFQELDRDAQGRIRFLEWALTAGDRGIGSEAGGNASDVEPSNEGLVDLCGIRTLSMSTLSSKK